MDVEIEEYLPTWAWELSHVHELVIMFHLVKPLALADPSNQANLRKYLQTYTNVKLILAHAERSFCAQHTIDGLTLLRGFGNVFFDTSAICEPVALPAILQMFGPSRLMYRSDFPVCLLRGRVVSLAEDFYWMLDNNVAWHNAIGPQPSLIGIESLLALQ